MNAAQNILAQSLRDMTKTTAAGEVVLACGAVSADTRRNPGVKLAAVKQEVKHKVPNGQAMLNSTESEFRGVTSVPEAKRAIEAAMAAQG